MSRMKEFLLGDTPYLPRLPGQITRNTDPHTSYQAAQGVTLKLKLLQSIVYDTLLRHPAGLTDVELEDLCGSHGSTYRTRRAELVELGLVFDTGTTRIVKGSNRKVWKAQ